MYAVSCLSPVVYICVICQLKRVIWLTHIGKQRENCCINVMGAVSIGRKCFLQNGNPSLCLMFAVDKNSVCGLTRLASTNVHHAVAVSVATTRGLR